MARIPAPKSGSELERSKPRRMVAKRILVVTEGEKTEPVYFNDLINDKRLRSAHVVKVDGSSGSSPMSVVEHGEKCFEKELKEGEEYDAVYCVFDRDQHANYQSAINRCRQHKSGAFISIESEPCFEIWCILHFFRHTAPFTATGGRSVGDNTVNELKKYIPGYSKKAKDLYPKLSSKTQVALDNAKALRRENEAVGSNNPSTRIDILVSELLDLAGE